MTVSIVKRDEVSPRFQKEIKRDHKMTTLVRVLSDGDVVAELYPEEGSVTMDSNAAVRRSTELTFHEDGNQDVMPTGSDDLLTPFGNEVQPCRGIDYGDGNQELVTQGIFRIDSTDVDDTGADVGVSVSGQDRGVVVDDAKFEDPYEIAAGTEATDAILELVQFAIPDVSYIFPDISVPLPKLIAQEQDSRWIMAQGIATSMGGELFFDEAGELVLQPVPLAASGQQIPHELHYHDDEDSLLLSVKRGWTRDGSFNRAIITGENSSNTIVPRGVATDDDPLSPTRYGGPFGIVPYFESSEFVSTDTQATDMAQGILNKNKGVPMHIDFGVVADPRLSVSLVIHVIRERIGVNEAHVIDTLSMPLTSEESVSGSTRSVPAS
jgi:hypothetical protein